MRELRPAELEEESLVAKIEHYARTVEKRGGTPIIVQLDGEEAPVGNAVQVCVFRVVQEALSNARKHADARKIDVSIRFTPAYVECIVKDDGVGFDTAKAEALDSTSHWGLASMKERMLMISGDLHIVSTPGQGTEVCVRAPLGMGG